MPIRCSMRNPFGPAGAGVPPFRLWPPTGMRPNLLASRGGGGAIGMAVSSLFLDPPGRARRTVHAFYVQLRKLDADAVGFRPILRRARGGPRGDQGFAPVLQPGVRPALEPGVRVLLQEAHQ